MVFWLDGVIKNSDNSIRKYKIKDSNGNVKDLASNQVKNLIRCGNTVEGLEIRNNRLLRVNKTVNYSNVGTKGNSGMRILSGAGLENFVYNHTAVGYRQRDFVDEIVNFCSRPAENRVMIIHGIRRTGKTTSIIQSIHRLFTAGVPSADVAYLIITNDTVKMENIIDFLNNTTSKYIFIDEVTKISDFYNNAAILADYYAVFKHIILTGTDSFVFPAVTKTNLYGRAHMIHSTTVSYREYTRVFNTVGNNPVDRYMSNGGSMLESEFYSESAIYKTLKSVVIDNIKHSIKVGIPVDSVLNKITDEQAMYLIFNFVFMATMPKDNGSILGDRKALSQRVIDTLASISGASTELTDYRTYNLPKGAAKAMLEALYELDIIGHIYNVTEESDTIKKQNTIEVIALIQALANEALSYNSNTGKATGFAFENMIIANILMWNRGRVYNIGFAKYIENKTQHEIDCVVQYVRDGVKHNICIEVKHSSEKDNSYTEHLNHHSLEMAIGYIDRKIVVYRGRTLCDNGVYFVNAHEFLINMDKWLMI